jgi:cytolysin-activating lysine-acyltransferase
MMSDCLLPNATRYESLEVIAPKILGNTFTEAEALGSATWLWMQSAHHRETPVYALSALLLPAIKYSQFVLAMEQGKPVFYLAWAEMNVDAEARYIKSPLQIQDADWVSGNRIWLLDVIAPFGHSRLANRMFRQRLMPLGLWRFLYHRGHEKGLRVMDGHGVDLSSKSARDWFDSHPAQ